MRIGIDGRTIQDHFPGIGRYTFQLIRALGQIDDEHEYVVYVDPNQVNSRFRLADLVAERIRLVDMPVGVFSLAEQLAVPRRLRHDRIDVFHSPYYVRPYWLPCPTVVTVHDAISSRYPAYMPSARARFAYEVAMRLTLATADAVIVPSIAARGDLEQYFGYPASRTTVIYEAADEFHEPPGGEPPAEVAKRVAQSGDNYLLFVGANKPHKNLTGLIDALRLVDGNLHLVVAGRWDRRFPGPLEHARTLGLADRVHFRGEVDEITLHWLLRRALALVLPSQWEGFGLPVLEAMAAGTPVICSNRGSLPEIAGGSALLVDPDQSVDLAAAITRLLTDEALRRDLVARGRQQAKQFAWRRTAAETLGVYEGVVRFRR